MKKLIVVPIALLVCAGAQADGLISYANNANTQVTQTIGGVNTVVPTTSISGVFIELFYQLDTGGPAPAPITTAGIAGTGWEPTTVTTIIPVPGGGIFNGPIQHLPDINIGSTGPGQNVWIDIVGWNNSAASLDAALSGGSTLFGASEVFAHQTENPDTIPFPQPPLPLYQPSPGAFTGLDLKPIPDSTPTLALSGISAVALLFFRPRKSS